MINFLFLFFVLFESCLYAGADLIFLPNKSVRKENILAINIQQHFPGIRKNVAMQQKLIADIKIVDKSDLPVMRPPINVLFTLKDLEIDLKAGDQESAYRTNQVSTSLFMAEVNDMVNRPIKLHFDEQFHLVPDTRDLIQLTKELPILTEIHPQSLVEELFQHQFALANRSLDEGVTYTVNFDDRIGIQPSTISYTITAITKEEVSADIKGVITSTSLDIRSKPSLNDKVLDASQLVIEGVLSGNITWNRSNALLYTLEVTTSYKGVYHIGDWDWKQQITVRNNVNTIEVKSE